MAVVFVILLGLGLWTIVYSEDLTAYWNSTDYEFVDDANDLDAETEIARLRQEFEGLSPYKDCPFVDDDPCECSITFDPERRISIVCRDFEDFDVLPNMMDKLRAVNFSSNLRTLFLYRCKISLPHNGLFDGLPFTGLHINEVEIDVVTRSVNDSRSPDIYKPLLGGLEASLQVVDFESTLLPGFELQGCSLGAFPNLRRFSLTESNVTKIPKEFFCCSYMSTEEVYLYGNDFEELEDGALSRATHLRLVQLNRNRIYLLSRNFFPYPALELQEIHLRNNDIASLPMDLFVSMPVLRYVDLSLNKLEHLPGSLWKPIWGKLFDVYLQDNSVMCDCTLRWLAMEEKLEISKEFKQQRFLLGQCYNNNHNTSDETELWDIDELQLPECQ